MRILTVADTVTKELLDPVGGGPYLENIDLIISCGDLPPEFLTSLKHRYNVPLLYVLGNHDIRYRSSPPKGGQCIDRKLINFNNLKIVGFSGSRWYNGGVNQYREKEMGRFINQMRLKFWRLGLPDIVVTHTPPRYVHDKEDRCHKGFKSFGKFIEKYSPAYFFHGHIHRQFQHDSERITTVNSTQVINSYGFFIVQIQSPENC